MLLGGGGGGGGGRAWATIPFITHAYTYIQQNLQDVSWISGFPILGQVTFLKLSVTIFLTQKVIREMLKKRRYCQRLKVDSVLNNGILILV